MKKNFVWIAIIFCCLSKAEIRTLDEGYDDYTFFCRLNEWRDLHPLSADSLASDLRRKRPPYVIFSPWYEDVYRQLQPGTVASVKRAGYMGYVLNPFTGGSLLTGGREEESCILEDSVYRSLPFDLVVYCRSGEDLDRFLCSEESQFRFLQSVFTPGIGVIDRKYQGRKAAGIHFYLPDVTFREKRKLIRFVKSVSMVIDAFETDGKRPYEGDNCLFTLTFSPEAREEMDYISGLLEFTDAVYFARYSEFGFLEAPSQKVDRFSDPSSLLVRMCNQFYLLRFGIPASSVLETGSDDFRELMKADYADYGWVVYFYTDVVLVFLLLLAVVLYNSCSPFYMLANRWRKYIFPVLLAFVTEAVILLLFMIELFSRYTLLLNMDGWQHYLLLALPLLFILIHVFFKSLAREEKVP